MAHSHDGLSVRGPHSLIFSTRFRLSRSKSISYAAYRKKSLFLATLRTNAISNSRRFFMISFASVYPLTSNSSNEKKVFEELHTRLNNPLSIKSFSSMSIYVTHNRSMSLTLPVKEIFLAYLLLLELDSLHLEFTPTFASTLDVNAKMVLCPGLVKLWRGPNSRTRVAIGKEN